MFQLSLTTYGQSLVSNTVSIDGLALSETYYSDLSSLENLSSVTIVLDDDAGGNFNGTTLNLRVKDSSSSVYQASTILLYKIVNGTKKVVAGFSQESAIVDKTEDSEVNLFLSFDSSCFTNGFILASIQASPVPAKINSDGLVHIENPDTSSDDIYSVYSKPQVDALLQDKQSALSAGEGISLANNVVKTTGIPFGIVDSTSTSTNFTVTVPGIYKLEDGVCCMVKNGVVTSASGFTLNVNGLGGKPCYTNLAAATRDTTLFNIAYTMLFVYDSTRVDGGCWICYRGYDANTNTIGYQLRTNSTVMTVTDTARYYKLYFTSADGTQWVPASVNSKNDATTARAVNQRPINPFGRIVYTSANTNYTQGSNLAATTIWDQYVITLGYSFNVSGGTLALSVNTPVYLKCAPQTDGSAIIDDTTPVVQALPSTADGKIYIFLGVATSATQIELFIDKPVYYYDGTGIRLWAGVTVPTKTSQLTNDAGFITTETDPTVPSWAKQSSKPSYNLDEVTDGTNRKLSNYELKTNLKEGAYVDVDETTMTASSTNLPTGKAVASYVTGLGYITSASLPTVNNATLTIKKNSDDTGTTFTANASQDVTANLGLHTVATSGSYNDLSNKPTIPTVNNASLTITKGGTNDTTSKTFTANASSNVEIHLGLGAAADKAVDSTIAAASTSTNLPTSQAVASFVEGKNYLTSHQSLAAQVATAQYNSTDKTIEFYNAAGTKLNTDIDATAFIKDGMVDTVAVENGNLVISFNTDAGKEGIEIPISDIFDADNYYTKDDVDGLIPTVNNATLTIKKNASDTGTTFTANASQDVTANLGLHAVATSGSYNDLSNKPTIPTVNNATLTIQKNGTTVNTFTANASSNVTANITVPVDTGDLTNNAGFITLNDIGSSFVTIATDQTITGEKTFDAGGVIVTDGTDLTFEYTDSATPVSTADNFAQIYTSSRTETDTTGDPITVPDLVINLSSADYVSAPTSDNAGVTQAKLSIRHGSTEVAYFGDNHFYSNSIGTSNNKVPTIYATDIYGELHGNATTATSAQSATTATSASYAANIGSNSSYTVATYVYNSNTDKALVPSVNASSSNYVNLGSSNRKWHTLYLSDSISNGTYTYSLPSATGTLALTSQLPTVNNKTITIKKDSNDTGDSFTLNQSSDKTINLGLAAVATSGSYDDLSDKPTIPNELTAGDGIAIDNNDVIRSIGIPFGIVDATSTSTAFTATVPGIDRLEDGVCILLKNGVVTSASGFTIDINELGAKPVYSNMAAATAETTMFNVNYTMLFIYDSTRIEGGCWILYRGYYQSDTNSIGYLLRTNNYTLPVTTALGRYRLLFTSLGGTSFIPVNSSTSTSATASKTSTLTTAQFDPFGRIVYYYSTSILAANASPGATTLYDQYAVNLGYSFAPITLTANQPVYLKCTPQTNGSVTLDATTPIVQALPSTNDGKVYILLGFAYSSSNIELLIDKPVYYYDGTGIRLWSGAAAQDLSNYVTLNTAQTISGTKTFTASAVNVSPTTSINFNHANDNNYSSISTSSHDSVDCGGTTTVVPDIKISAGTSTRHGHDDDGYSRLTIGYSDGDDIAYFDYKGLHVDTIYASAGNIDDLYGTLHGTATGLDTLYGDDNITLSAQWNSTLSADEWASSANIIAPAFKVPNGTSSQFLKADGSLDSNTYITSASLPTVNNASLTINKGGTNDTTSKTFTANAATDVTINLGLGAAADKAVDTSIGSSSSTNLPTTNAVKSYVTGLGYITSSDIPITSISVNGVTQTITNHNVDLTIDNSVQSADFICSMTRTNVSGSGNLTLSGTVGPFPVSGTPMPAGTYLVRTRMQSTTASYTLTVSFGGSYTLTSSNGVIDDIREITLSSASTYSASITQVNANTFIKVTMYEPDVAVETIGAAAVTNDYNDLDNIPTVGAGTLTIQRNGSSVATFNANNVSNVTANISVPTTVASLSDASNYVTTNTTQTISGMKTFTSSLYLNSTSYVTGQSQEGISVWCNSSTDNTNISGLTISPSVLDFILYTYDENDSEIGVVPVSIQSIGVGSSRIMIDADYTYLSSDSRLIFGHDNGSYLKLYKTTHSGTNSNDETVDIPDLMLDMSGADISDQSRFIIKSADDTVGYFTNDGLYVNKVEPTCQVGPYVVCSTAKGTAKKEVTIPGYVIKTGSRLVVKFANENTASTPTLCIHQTSDDTGETHDIKIFGTTKASSNAYNKWYAGSVIEFIYDGTNWVWSSFLYYALGSTYATYVGSTSTNYVATFEYTSATDRAFKPRVDASASALVNLGTASYRWNILYLANGISDGTNTFSLPSSSGTLALVSDIPSAANYVTLNTAQTITGVKSFDANIEVLEARDIILNYTDLAEPISTANNYAKLHTDFREESDTSGNQIVVPDLVIDLSTADYIAATTSDNEYTSKAKLSIRRGVNNEIAYFGDNHFYATYIGTELDPVEDIYANDFHGSLDGNASTATTATNATNLSYSGTAKLTATSSQVTAKDDIIPSTNSTGTNGYDLGSPSYKWRRLYLSGGISNGTDTYSLPSATGTLALTSDLEGIFCVSSGGNDPVSQSSVRTQYDYRPIKSGSFDNPKFKGNYVSLGVNRAIDFTSQQRISVYVLNKTYVGSIAFLESSGSEYYKAYPVYFRGAGSEHNATVPAGSVLRMTFYNNAFNVDFYDLADFGIEHEPIVRVGKLIHQSSDPTAYNGTLVGIRKDNGKADRLITVDTLDSSGEPYITESLLEVDSSSPIYVSFNLECFASHPRVPFGFITNVEYLDDFGVSVNSDYLKFYYVENGSIVTNASTLQSHIVTNTSNNIKYFHINNAPVYIIMRGATDKYVTIGGIPSHLSGKLIGFLCSSESEAGLLRLVDTRITNYANKANELVYSEGSTDVVLSAVSSNTVSSKHIYPSSNTTYNLGGAYSRWNNVYANRFNGVPVIAYAESTVSSSTAAKTLSSKSNFPSTLATGDIICIYFTYSNTSTSTPTITDGTNTFTLYRTNSVAVGNTLETSWPAQSYNLFRINGTKAVMMVTNTYPTSTASGTTNIIPSADNTYNLGSASYKWKQAHANDIYAYRVYFHSSGDTSYSDSLPYLSYYSGRIESGSNIYPWNDNTYSLGASGQAWKSIFAKNVYGGLFAECDTDAATQIKDITLDFAVTPFAGLRISVKFAKTNTASSPQLCINNSSTTYPIVYRGTSAVSNSSNYYRWQANDTVDLVFDGTSFVMAGWQQYASSASTSSYASYIGTSSTNYVATYSYTSATNRCLRPRVDYSSTAFVDLGSASYRWGTLYCNAIGNSSNKVTDLYVTNINGSPYSGGSSSSSTYCLMWLVRSCRVQAQTLVYFPSISDGTYITLAAHKTSGTSTGLGGTLHHASLTPGSSNGHSTSQPSLSTSLIVTTGSTYSSGSFKCRSYVEEVQFYDQTTSTQTTYLTYYTVNLIVAERIL